MGKESPCRARIGGREVKGRVQLETDDLTFRGPLRLVIPLRDISSAEANGGELRIVYGPGDVAVFDIGRQAAETWAGAIRNPRGLLDKLGVKPGTAVSVLGSFDREFIDDVSGRAGPVSVGRGRKDSDMVFLGIERPSDLVKLDALRDSIADDGAVWAVYRKGRRDLREIDVIEAGRAAGLVDTKVVRFSDTHTGLKFVIPVADRRSPSRG